MTKVMFEKTRALGRDGALLHLSAERTMFSVLLAERLTKSNPLCVLDFGGACGIHHMVADRLGIALRWALVESPIMAATAAPLSSATLQFFSDIDQATRWIGGAIDLMFSSGTLSYVDDPEATLRQLVALRAPLMVWSRLAMSDGEARRDFQVFRLAHCGLGPLPPGFADRDVSGQRTFLSRDKFLAAHEGYALSMKYGDLESGQFDFLRDDMSL